MSAFFGFFAYFMHMSIFLVMSNRSFIVKIDLFNKLNSDYLGRNAILNILP